MLCLSLALAAPDAVSWSNLNDVADHRFDVGPGQAHDAWVSASERAIRTVPLGPTGVRVEAQVGEPTQQQLLAAVEVPLSLGIRERRLHAAQHEQAVAQRETERWRWVQDVQGRWRDWWIAATVEADLRIYAEEVDRSLAALQDAVDDGLLAVLTLDDLRAEGVQVQAELAQIVAERTVAEAALRALIGDVTLDAASTPALPAHNPWAPVAIDRLAAVQEADATARVAAHEARRLGDAWTPTVFAGPMWAPDDQGKLVPFATVGIAMPLQPGVRSERRRAQGRAAAADADRRWQRTTLEVTLAGERAGWTAGRDHLDTLQTTVIAPLQNRERRLQEAFQDGLVTADRLVRARQQSHEAEHEAVRLQGSLLASHARAAWITSRMEIE